MYQGRILKSGGKELADKLDEAQPRLSLVPFFIQESGLLMLLNAPSCSVNAAAVAMAALVPTPIPVGVATFVAVVVVVVIVIVVVIVAAAAVVLVVVLVLVVVILCISMYIHYVTNTHVGHSGSFLNAQNLKGNKEVNHLQLETAA